VAKLKITQLKISEGDTTMVRREPEKPA